MIERGRLLRAAGLFAAAAILAGTAACGASEGAQGAIPLATATPDDPPPHEEPATIDVLATPDVEVRVDGKPAGKTPLKGYKVSAGSHDVTFVDETGNRTMTINVEPGEGKTVKSDRPPSMIERKR